GVDLNKPDPGPAGERDRVAVDHVPNDRWAEPAAYDLLALLAARRPRRGPLARGGGRGRRTRTLGGAPGQRKRDEKEKEGRPHGPRHGRRVYVGPGPGSLDRCGSSRSSRPPPRFSSRSGSATRSSASPMSATFRPKR